MRKNIVLMSILMFALPLIFCGGGRETEISGGKMVQIAAWEDRRYADTLLFNYLGDDNPEIRARACYALGLIEPEGASAYIAELLSDPDEKVRLEAVFAMGLLADSLYSEDMIELLADSSEAIVHQAAVSLGKMGGDTAVSALMAFAKDTITEHRAWACEGLWRAKAFGAVELLKNMLTDSSTVVEESAIYALRRLADKSSAGNLRFRLRDTIPEIRIFASEGLAAMADSASLMELSNALSREKEWTVKASLLRAIAVVGDKRVIKTLMNLLSEDEHPLISALAMDVIARLEINTLIPRIEPFLKSRESYSAGAAMTVLARLQGEKLLDRISGQIDGFDWYLRMKTAEALQYIKSPRSANLLEKFLKDGDHRVRCAALVSLTKFDFVDINNYLSGALEDSDPAVVSTAIDIISEQKLGDYTARVLEIYDGAEEDVEFRFSILYSARGWIVDSNIIDPNIVRLLNTGLEDKYRMVRKLAVDIFEEIGRDKSAQLGYFRTDINADTYKTYYGRFDKNPIAEINTSRGQIRVELLYDQAPRTVINFINLAESGFYDGVIFHRVVPNFVIQAGDPHGEGWGGPGYSIRSEFNRHEYTAGTMGMAHSGKDTGGSQWFICHSPQPHLNARYTAFGQVIYGMRIVDRILAGDTINSIDILYPED